MNPRLYTRPMFPYVHPGPDEPVYCRVCGRPAVNDSYSNDEICERPSCTAVRVIEETLYAFTGLLPEEV